MGAGPLQPPAYEMVAGEVGSYSAPPGDVSDAPPLYEDIAKESVAPPEVTAQLQSQEDKACAGEGGPHSSHRSGAQ